MAKPDNRAEVRISLQGIGDSDDLPRFHPGDAISGRVEITPRQDLKAQSVAIQLKWYTEGKGDRDEQVIGEQPIYHQGALAAGAMLSGDFRFDLPDQPWSYAGHYINIVWAINVKIDLPMAHDVNVERRIILSPEAAPQAESGW